MSITSRIYDRLGPRQHYWLDRVRFAAGILPRINLAPNPRPWLAPYRAALVISADFELGWAWRYVRNSTLGCGLPAERASQTRSNMPRLLAIFDQYNVPATWATVGHLFLEHCECQGGAKHPEVARAPYYRSEHWSYETGDWFDADPCSDYQRDPAWYAPDLLRDIVAARVGHEIACHTFSHIDSSDEHCPAEVMDTELAACSRAAAAWGITLKSFVFPGNHPGNYASLKRHGFLAYRRHGHYHLDWPQQDALGLWQVPGGLRWETPPRWSPRDWQTVLCHAVDQALATGTMLHLWFHPSCDPVNLECVFPMLLAYVNARRDRLWVGTMEQLVKHMATAAPAERQNPWGR